MRYKYSLILSILLPFYLFSQDNSFQFNNISVKDGMSQNTVIRIFQDSKNFMWFCTRDGLNRYDGTSFRVFRASINDTTSISSSDVTSIAENKDGTFWIGSHNGLNLYDPRNETFTHYLHSDNNKNSISSSGIKHILTDRSGKTWIGTTKGLDIFEPATKTFKHFYKDDAIVWIMQRANGDICYASVRDGFFVFSTKTNQLINYPFPQNDFIYTLFEDSNQNLWAGMWSNSLKKWNPATKLFDQISLKTTTGQSFDHEQIGYMVENAKGTLMLATRKGILVYNTNSKTVTERISNRANQLSDNKIISLLKDRTGGIWIGSWNGGVDFYSPYSNYFSSHNPNTAGRDMVGCINSVVEANGLIWLGTDNGLITYNRSTNNYQTVNLGNTLSNEVKYLFKDKDKLWVSLYTGGLHVLDVKSQRIEQSIKDFKYGYVKAIAKDEVGNYWIAAGTNDPFLMLDSKTNTLISRFQIKGSKRYFAPINVQDVLLENGQTVWIGTRSEGLYCYNFKTKALQHIVAKADTTSLSNNHVSVLFRDSKKNLWVGTFGGGFSKFNSQNGTFKTYNHENGLLNDAVCGIMEDVDGSLWISTLQGISQFSPQKGTFNSYNHNNGYPLQEAVLHACTKTADNTFFVGGVNELVSFKPSQIKKNPFVPNVAISKFKVWADNVSEVESNSKSVYPDKKVKLKYDQAAFTIYFAALNFVFPNKNQYAYKLEGFDKNWNFVKNERSATYTNIPPGKYTFRVKACNNDGVWNNTGTSFEIRILPPPWKTWWAYTLYLLIFGGISGGYIYYFLSKQKLENDITIKQIEQKNLEENHQLGVRLFTNFSHELRTPLTLIIGPLNEILSKFDLPDKVSPKLELIYKNAQRLLWLVNQLMDFRKLESGFMKPNVSRVNINSYLGEIALTFRELAITKSIAVDLIKNENDSELWIDPVLTEKVFFNLLSNAIKHTNKNGKIEISIKEIEKNEAESLFGKRIKAEKAILIDITDNGDGIESHELEKIFEPFYQAQNHEGTNIYGTGIGLNLCKTIIELHQGKIWAESEPNQGSTFRILLQMGNQHFSKEELSLGSSKELERSEIVNLLQKGVETEKQATSFEPKNSEVFTVLIVEDNEDIRLYIKSLLIDKYTILEAEDCAIGCNMAIEYVPDLILSDIMTPNMSGIELCTLLKNNDVTNHIPIILLTALAGLEQMKEGFTSLADDYITKPFDPELLQLRVENLIRIRKRIRDAYRKNSVYGNIKIDLPSAESTFMTKVFDYIKKNMDNPELRIESFSEDIGMSRVQLYRKIKSITGKTPSALILEIRMNAASDLLKNTDFNVNEIAYQLGFNDSSYFGKCFKAHFGTTPSEYKA